MTLIGVGLAVVTAGAAAGAAAGALAPVRLRPLVAGLLTAVVGVGGVLAGVAALSGQVWSLTVPHLLPLGAAQFAVDPLSGVFLFGLLAVSASFFLA